MKRAELLKLLEGFEKAQEVIDFVMSENGKDIENVKTETTKLQEKITQQEAELKKFEKGGEKFVDVEELNRLKTFETETIERQKTESKTKAVTEWLKNEKASEKAISLLTKAIDFNAIELDNGAIKDFSQLKKIKENYSDFFVTETQSGVKPSAPPPTQKTTAEPRNLAEAIRQQQK